MSCIKTSPRLIWLGKFAWIKNGRKTLRTGFIRGRPKPLFSLIDTPDMTKDVIESGAVNSTFFDPRCLFSYPLLKENVNPIS